MSSYTLSYILYDKYMNILKQGLRMTKALNYYEARENIETELIASYKDVAWVKVK